MSITIAEIVETALLQTRLLAGSRGSGRTVAWAHTCELPDPWNWLGENELLLSDGYNFPSAAGDQVQFISRLASARLAGLALAEGMHAAPLSAEAAATADSLGFPILVTGYDVPFVTLSRAVAEKNSRASVLGLTRVLGVYERLHRSPVRRGLLEQLEMDVSANLYVIDAASGRALLESRVDLPPSTSGAITNALRNRSGPLPAHTRIVAGDEQFLIIPLSRPRAVLVAQPLESSDASDLSLLQHIASIAELEITRRIQDAHTARRTSTELFARMLDGDIGNDRAEARLEAAGFREGNRRVIAIPHTPEAPELHAQLFHEGINLLFMERAGVALCFTDAPDDVVNCIATIADSHIGISLTVATVARLADAVREARWAAEAAQSSRSSVVTYGGCSAPFLPRTPEEARSVVDRVLGPVIAYDLAENSELLDTLERFFEADRSWQTTARHLGVHKQTVVYRIRRIESLTGRNMRDMGDQTELYLSLRARRLLDI